MQGNKKKENNFWWKLLLLLWGVAYFVLGIICWYLIFTTDSGEPIAILLTAALGIFTLWSGGKTVYSILADND